MRVHLIIVRYEERLTMKMTVCKHCSTRVLPTNSGQCPCCRKDIAGSVEIEVEAEEIPAESPQPHLPGQAVSLQVSVSPPPPASKSFGGEILGTVVLVLIVSGFFIFRDMGNPSGKANYDKVQVGMSLAEVEEILGTRLSIPDSDRAHFTGSGKWWAVDYVSVVGPLRDTAMKEINVKFRDGVVVSKSRSEH